MNRKSPPGKRLVVVLALVFSFLSVHAADITFISTAFKSGNATGLTSSLGEETDVAIPGTSRKCDAKAAVSVLNTFFDANKPNGFTVLHNADKKDNGFLVGKLPTTKGEFRVNITYRSENNKVIIQSIRIE